MIPPFPLFSPCFSPIDTPSLCWLIFRQLEGSTQQNDMDKGTTTAEQNQRGKQQVRGAGQRSLGL
jgi:hypothetical protein